MIYKKKKYLYLLFQFLFLLFTLLLLFQFFKTFFSLKQGFQVDSTKPIKNILFLGDSILNNQLYVSSERTVQDFLKKKYSYPVSIFNYAQDGATILSVYHQLDHIPEYLNSAETVVFLSIGGNDILVYFLKNPQNRKEEEFISTLYFSYQTLLKIILKKMNLCKIYILDIYYPVHPSFQTYLPFLKKWNHLLETNHENIPIIKISSYLKESKDFFEFIEPSEYGAEKIANLLFNYTA